eukprot:TRINITY_DN2485_c0_g1_i2.p2 TRINITY_DN2485_c0_g1~~TRINITY_DN2485_c0_g1_i2.p2  ORF type:complete len:420 (-),score=139.33 TRINITY_DN2485_c0_g1_i2:1651-2847(-)
METEEKDVTRVLPLAHQVEDGKELLLFLEQMSSSVGAVVASVGNTFERELKQFKKQEETTILSKTVEEVVKTIHHMSSAILKGAYTLQVTNTASLHALANSTERNAKEAAGEEMSKLKELQSLLSRVDRVRLKEEKRTKEAMSLHLQLKSCVAPIVIDRTLLKLRRKFRETLTALDEDREKYREAVELYNIGHADYRSDAERMWQEMERTEKTRCDGVLTYLKGLESELREIATGVLDACDAMHAIVANFSEEEHMKAIRKNAKLAVADEKMLEGLRSENLPTFVSFEPSPGDFGGIVGMEDVVDDGKFSAIGSEERIRVVVHSVFTPPARGGDFLALPDIGMLVSVVQMDPTGWWYGEFKGKKGYFPSNFVDMCDSFGYPVCYVSYYFIQTGAWHAQ